MLSPLPAANTKTSVANQSIQLVKVSAVSRSCFNDLVSVSASEDKVLGYCVDTFQDLKLLTVQKCIKIQISEHKSMTNHRKRNFQNYPAVCVCGFFFLHHIVAR